MLSYGGVTLSKIENHLTQPKELFLVYIRIKGTRVSNRKIQRTQSRESLDFSRKRKSASKERKCNIAMVTHKRSTNKIILHANARGKVILDE